MAWIDTKYKRTGPRYYVCWRGRNPLNPTKKRIFRSPSYRTKENAQVALEAKEQELLASAPPKPQITLRVVNSHPTRDPLGREEAEVRRRKVRVRFTSFAYRKKNRDANGDMKPYGRWLASWRDEFGEKQSKSGFMTRETAKAFAHNQLDLVQQRLSGRIPITGSDKPIIEAIDAFCSRPADRRGPICEETHVLNRRNVERYVTFGKIKTTEMMTKTSVEKWWNQLKADGCETGGQGFNLKIIKAFCNFCRKKGWLRKDPFEDVAVPRGSSKGTYLLPDQRHKLLTIVDPRYRELDERWCRVTQFGLYSCLRIGQVFTVDWTHFNPETGKLKVVPWKRQRERVIRLHPKAVQAMGEVKGAGKIFGFWQSIEAMRESFKKRVKRLNMKGVRFHDTGHTMISRLFELGYSPAEVREYTGKSWTTIQQYSHVYKKHLEEKIVTFDYPQEAKAVAKPQIAWEGWSKNDMGTQVTPGNGDHRLKKA